MNARFLPLLALLLASPAAAAVPSVAIHWGTCPVDPSINRNATVGTIETITLTAKGLSGPVRGVQGKITLKSVNGLPPGWRFDAAGCEAGRLAIGPGSAGGSCPSLQNTNPQHVENVTFNPLTGIETIQFARTFDVINADPGQTYTLARFDFDHTLPDPCGCVDQPVCFGINAATYVDGSITEWNFAIENEFLTWNDPTNSIHCPDVPNSLGPGNCAPTPTVGKSWGSIKSTYR